MTLILPQEAEILSQYLIGADCTQEIADDFSKAVAELNISLTERQTKLYKQMLGSQFLLRAVDGGLVFIHPHSNIRKRIFTMLTLLEASKHYTAKFLPVERSPLYFIQIAFDVAWGFATAVLGILVIKLHGAE